MNYFLGKGIDTTPKMKYNMDKKTEVFMKKTTFDELVAGGAKSSAITTEGGEKITFLIYDGNIYYKDEKGAVKTARKVEQKRGGFVSVDDCVIKYNDKTSDFVDEIKDAYAQKKNAKKSASGAVAGAPIASPTGAPAFSVTEEKYNGLIERLRVVNAQMAALEVDAGNMTATAESLDKKLYRKEAKHAKATKMISNLLKEKQGILAELTTARNERQEALRIAQEVVGEHADESVRLDREVYRLEEKLSKEKEKHAKATAHITDRDATISTLRGQIATLNASLAAETTRANAEKARADTAESDKAAAEGELGEERKKSGKLKKIGIGVLSAVVAVGLAFGVWAVVGQVNSSNLKEENDKHNEQTQTNEAIDRAEAEAVTDAQNAINQINGISDGVTIGSEDITLTTGEAGKKPTSVELSEDAIAVIVANFDTAETNSQAISAYQEAYSEQVGMQIGQIVAQQLADNFEGYLGEASGLLTFNSNGQIVKEDGVPVLNNEVAGDLFDELVKELSATYSENGDVVFDEDSLSAGLQAGLAVGLKDIEVEMNRAPEIVDENELIENAKAEAEADVQNAIDAIDALGNNSFITLQETTLTNGETGNMPTAIVLSDAAKNAIIANFGTDETNTNAVNAYNTTFSTLLGQYVGEQVANEIFANARGWLGEETGILTFDENGNAVIENKEVVLNDATVDALIETISTSTGIENLNSANFATGLENGISTGVGVNMIGETITKNEPKEVEPDQPTKEEATETTINSVEGQQIISNAIRVQTGDRVTIGESSVFEGTLFARTADGNYLYRIELSGDADTITNLEASIQGQDVERFSNFETMLSATNGNEVIVANYFDGYVFQDGSFGATEAWTKVVRTKNGAKVEVLTLAENEVQTSNGQTMEIVSNGEVSTYNVTVNGASYSQVNAIACIAGSRIPGYSAQKTGVEVIATTSETATVATIDEGLSK